MTNERRRRATTGRSVRTGQSEEEDAEHQLGCSLHVESLWCLVRWPPDGQHHQNGAFLLGKIITKPPSRNSCNCHRPWPPYGGWPYTSPIECLHTLTTQSAKPAQQDNTPTWNQERVDLHNFRRQQRKRLLLPFQTRCCPQETLGWPQHTSRDSSPSFSSSQNQLLASWLRSEVTTCYFTIIPGPPESSTSLVAPFSRFNV